MLNVFSSFHQFFYFMPYHVHTLHIHTQFSSSFSCFKNSKQASFATSLFPITCAKCQISPMFLNLAILGPCDSVAAIISRPLTKLFSFRKAMSTTRFSVMNSWMMLYRSRAVTTSPLASMIHEIAIAASILNVP